MKKRTLTIFLHNGMSIIVENRRLPKGFWGRIFRVLRAPYDLCFFVGSGFVSATEKINRFINREFLRTAAALRKRGERLRERQFRASLGLLLLLMIVVAAGFKSLNLVAYGLALKDKVLAIASRGGWHLQNAQSAIGGQNVVLAENEFRRAQESFRSSQEEIAEAGVLLNTVSSLMPQKRDADNILQASDLVAKSGLAMTRFYDSVSRARLTAAGLVSSGEPIQAVAANIERGLDEAVEYLEEAQSKAERVNPNRVPESFRPDVIEMQEKLRVLTGTLKSLREIFYIAKGIMMGDKHILLVLQNNNELRPTGGFMGSFGALDMKDGYIEQLHISSMYDLDGQLHEQIVPPTPLLSVNDRWYLRDSNWFADFPLSAKKIISFYEKEGGETPDVIVGLTASVIVELLRVTGPIELPKYGITLDAENFIEQTQVQTSVQKHSPENAPKQILADFFPVLLQKLSEDPGRTAALADVLQRQALGKNLAIYARERKLQERIARFNWAGAVAPTDRDYLMVNTANFSGSKSDLYIEQGIEVQTEIHENGEMFNTVTIRRINTLPRRAETVNDSFVRLYVPEGSQLLESSGFDLKSFQAPDPENQYKEDGDVRRWEQSAKRDIITGMVVGLESGKTFFGNWLKLEGGQSRDVMVRYKLPFTLKDLDRYSLLLQKQMGAVDASFTVSVFYRGRTVAWKNFDSDESTADSLTVRGALSKDIFYGAVFKKD